MASKTCWAGCVNQLKANLLSILLLTGVSLGVVFGIVLKIIIKDDITPRQAIYVSFPGKLLLNMLKYVALPLVASCIVSAIGSLDLKAFQRMGWQIVVFTVGFHIVAALLALVLTLIIRPGTYGRGASASGAVTSRKTTTVDTFLDCFRNTFPSSMIGMFVIVHGTQLMAPKGGEDRPVDQWDVSDKPYISWSANMLGIICVSISVGVATAVKAESARPMLDFAVAVSVVVMRVTTWIIWACPVLLIFLIAGQILGTMKILTVLTQVGMYYAVYFLCLTIYVILILPLVYFVIVRQNPFTFYRRLMPSIMTSFATSSSLATMPVALQCLDEAGVEPRVSRLVIPVAVNICKLGACARQMCMIVFIAQMHGMNLSAGQLFGSVCMSVAGATAAAGVPFASVVVVTLMLGSLGLPVSDVGLLLAADFIPDRGSTVVNIMGNCIMAAVLDRWNRDILGPPPEEKEAESKTGTETEAAEENK